MARGGGRHCGGPTALDPERVRGLAGIRHVLRRFLAASEAISREGGVTPQQYQAMLVIRAGAAEGVSIKDLAEELMLTHHAVVQLVDRLARAGWAARERSAGDRRRVLVRLTSGGDALFEQLASRHLDEMLAQEPLLSRSLRQLKRLGRGAGP